MREQSEVHVRLSTAVAERQVVFRSRDATLRASPESVVAASLLAWMRAGGAHAAPERVDARFLSSLDVIQGVLSAWDPRLSRVHVASVPTADSPRAAAGVGAFFSGGVDSFYTLLKRRDEIDCLIFVHGFDVDLAATRSRAMASTMVRHIGAELRKEVIEIETYLKEALRPFVHWGLAHGAGMAAVGHLLRSRVGRIYIPATHTYAQLFPWGSHPLLDPLWSSRDLEFVHDGCEATRVGKVGTIAECVPALACLRVCLASPPDDVNCGRCEKCIRTMINLKIHAALHRCATFTTPLTVRAVLRLHAGDENTRAFVGENIAALRARKTDRALVWALRWVLCKAAFSRAWRRLARVGSVTTARPRSRGPGYS